MLDHYRAGRVAEAVRGCDAVLAGDPHHAEALQLLGVAADASGDPARAAALIGQALAVRETASLRCNHGMALAIWAATLRRCTSTGLPMAARLACARASPTPGPTWAARCAASVAPSRRSRPANRP